MNEEFELALQLKTKVKEIQLYDKDTIMECGKQNESDFRELLIEVCKIDSQYCNYLLGLEKLDFNSVQRNLYSLRSIKKSTVKSAVKNWEKLIDALKNHLKNI